MTTLDLPPYSPDLQPLDYSLWQEVEKKASDKIGDRHVTAAQYRRILRTAALRLSPVIVGKAVEGMRRRVRDIHAAKGSHIQGD